MEAKKKRKPGAGVKPDDGVHGERKQLRLDPATEAIFAKIGAGNVSLGAREAARRLIEHKDVAKFSTARHAERQK